MAWFKDSAGVEEQGMCTGGPPGTWEALPFPPENVVGEATTQITPAQGGGADLPGRDEQPSTGWYRQAKATKRGGRKGRDSEQPVVAEKAGNQPVGPAGAKGLPEHGVVGGKGHGNAESRFGLNETTTDSRAGEGGP